MVQTAGSASDLIGGYDPVSWTSSGGFVEDITDAGRTAFIFDLTTSVIQRQNLIGQGFVNGGVNSGTYQTNDNATFGPTFGAGSDLFTDISPGDGLAANTGYVCNYSYGISTGITCNSANLLGFPGLTFFSIGALEVYTVNG